MTTLLDALLPRSRQRVLAVTFMHPDRWWYVRDLARRLAVAPSNAHRQLRALASAVLGAPDGKAALAVLQGAAKIDLLLSDVVLPGGMSGPELAAIARGQSGVKVLFMSGYTRDTMAYQSQLGDDALLLQKPFRKSELAEMVRAVLTA